MSRQLKRQIIRARNGRGAGPSPTRPRPAGAQQQRLNRWLLIGGAGFAIAAVVIAVRAPHFDGGGLAFNLAAIALGLLTGKFIGTLVFRRLSPTGGK